MTPKELLAVKGDFLRTIGQILSCVVRFMEDDEGKPKIEALYADEVFQYANLHWSHTPPLSLSHHKSAQSNHRKRLLKKSRRYIC